MKHSKTEEISERPKVQKILLKKTFLKTGTHNRGLSEATKPAPYHHQTRDLHRIKSKFLSSPVVGGHSNSENSLFTLLDLGNKQKGREIHKKSKSINSQQKIFAGNDQISPTSGAGQSPTSAAGQSPTSAAGQSPSLASLYFHNSSPTSPEKFRFVRNHIKHASMVQKISQLKKEVNSNKKLSLKIDNLGPARSFDSVKFQLLMSYKQKTKPFTELATNNIKPSSRHSLIYADAFLNKRQEFDETPRSLKDFDKPIEEKLGEILEKRREAYKKSKRVSATMYSIATMPDIEVAGNLMKPSSAFIRTKDGIIDQMKQINLSLYNKHLKEKEEPSPREPFSEKELYFGEFSTGLKTFESPLNFNKRRKITRDDKDISPLDRNRMKNFLTNTWIEGLLHHPVGKETDEEYEARLKLVVLENEIKMQENEKTRWEYSKFIDSTAKKSTIKSFGEIPMIPNKNIKIKPSNIIKYLRENALPRDPEKAKEIEIIKTEGPDLILKKKKTTFMEKELILDRTKYKKVRKSLREFFLTLKNLNISMADLFVNPVFSRVPYEKTGSYAFIKYTKKGLLEEVVKMLEKDKFLVFDFDEFHMTATHWACRKGHELILDELIRNNAQINVFDKARRTPLYFAAKSGYTQIVKNLFYHGANPWSYGRCNYQELNLSLEIKDLFKKAKQLDTIRSISPTKLKIQIWEEKRKIFLE